MFCSCSNDAHDNAATQALVIPDSSQSSDAISDLDVVGLDAANLDGAEEQDMGQAPEQTPCAVDGGWGCPCEKNDECLSDFCLESEDGKICTQTCIETCPKNWKCVQAGVDDPTFICMPRFVKLCRPCKTHDNCGQAGMNDGKSKCIPFEKNDGAFVNGSFCGTPCTTNDECPKNFSCAPIALPGEATVSQCIPDNSECSCSPAEVALKSKTSCWRSNEFGKCMGERVCTLDGLTFCDVAEPAAEVCDGEDNDCDGETDEEGAVGCAVWYPDNDGDGAGITQGKCLCNNPGVGYAKSGGDCNDFVKTISPGAKEICNQIDDNCNGQTDESGASGCTTYFKDKDGDTFGDADDAACLCPSKKTPDYIEQAGDCDDENKDIKPGAIEMCDGKDNNCNEKTDEEGAAGCSLYYLDVDGDGYGPTDNSKCLCKASTLYTATKPGDCEDTNKKVYPTKLETCNGVDDDCNGQTDDGEAYKSCPSVPKGQPACVAGKCAVGECSPGYFNISPTIPGCECKADSNYGKVGGTCQGAIQIKVLGDGGTSEAVTGNVMPGEDGDWYSFKAVDSPQPEGGCNTFHVRARFMQPSPKDNPFVLDLFKGSCAGKSQICNGQLDTSWTVRFYGKPFGLFVKQGTASGNVHKSPNPLPAGECKCSNKKGTTGPGALGMNFCANHTDTFYVRVRLKPGAKATCASYKVELSNGVYKPAL